MTSPRRERLRFPCKGAGSVPPRRGRHRSAPIPVGSQTPPPPRRGGPMCPPEHAASWDPCTGRHTGRPLQIQLQPSSTPENRAGAEPRPYSRRTPKTASRSTRPPQTSSPATQNTLHDRRHPALILRPPSQRKKTPPSVSEQGFPKGGLAPFGRFKGVPGGKQGSRRKPAQRLRWEKEEQRNE